MIIREKPSTLRIILQKINLIHISPMKLFLKRNVAYTLVIETLWSYRTMRHWNFASKMFYLFLDFSLSSIFLLLKETINVDWCELVWVPRLPLYIKRYISPCFPPMPRHLLSVSVAIFVVKPFLVCDFVDIWNKHGAKLANYILNFDYTNIHA